MSENTMLYVVQNSSKETTIIIEPWAEEFVLSPNSKLSVTISYVELGRLETEITPEYFIINVWNGCRAKVLMNDKDVTPPSLQIRTPS